MDFVVNSHGLFGFVLFMLAAYGIVKAFIEVKDWLEDKIETYKLEKKGCQYREEGEKRFQALREKETTSDYFKRMYYGADDFARPQTSCLSDHLFRPRPMWRDDVEEKTPTFLDRLKEKSKEISETLAERRRNAVDNSIIEINNSLTSLNEMVLSMKSSIENPFGIPYGSDDEDWDESDDNLETFEIWLGSYTTPDGYISAEPQLVGEVAAINFPTACYKYELKAKMDFILACESENVLPVIGDLILNYTVGDNRNKVTGAYYLSFDAALKSFDEEVEEENSELQDNRTL